MPTETRTALLDSAEKAARARGFDGFSYADIAKDVGIRKASIHHHFPTKAALSAALMQRYARAFETTFRDIEANHISGAARLNALVETYHSALAGGQSLCLCVSFSVSHDNLAPTVLEEMTSFRKMILDWLTNTFGRSLADGSISGVGDPAQEAAAALATLEGAQLAARTAGSTTPFENALALLKSRLVI